MIDETNPPPSTLHHSLSEQTKSFQRHQSQQHGFTSVEQLILIRFFYVLFAILVFFSFTLPLFRRVYMIPPPRGPNDPKTKWAIFRK